jgi:hypothetical protein
LLADREMWEMQKKAYLKAGVLWLNPVEEVVVKHRYAEGRDRGEIPVYVRVPKMVHIDGEKDTFPVVVLMTGLDGYRPDNTVRCEEFLARGW